MALLLFSYPVIRRCLVQNNHIPWMVARCSFFFLPLIVSFCNRCESFENSTSCLIVLFFYFFMLVEIEIIFFLYSALDKIIVQGYKALQLQYFFTSGPDEVKAWTIQVSALITFSFIFEPRKQ